MGLQGSHQGVSDFMVGNHQFFMVRQYGIPFLVTGNNHLDAFFQIGFVHNGTSVSHGTEGCFINNIGKLCTGGAGCHSGNGVEIHIFAHFNLSGMNFENGLPAR